MCTIESAGFVRSGIEAISKEESITVPSQAARCVISIANDMKKWTEQVENNVETTRFEET